LDYYLNRNAKDVKLEIVNDKNEIVRRFTSSDKLEMIDTTAIPHPTYWIRPPQHLSTLAGQHRFIWDLRHEPPPGSEREFAIAAVFRNTPTGPHGPFVHPGRYTVRLTVDGAVQERPLDVRLDPRVTIGAAEVQLQTDYSLACYKGYLRLQKMRESIDALLLNRDMQRNVKKQEALQALRGSGPPGNPDLLYGSITAASFDKETIVGLQNKFLYLLNVLQNAEARPTQQTIAGIRALEEMMETLTRRWEVMQ